MKRNGQDNKVIPFSYVVKNNAAILVFVLIFIYILASIIISMTKKPTSTYRVSASNINNNISCTGIAIRSEQLISCNKSGYACYYVRDGERVPSGAVVCTIDANGDFMDMLSSAGVGTDIFTDDDYNEIRSYISNYKSTYSDEEFVAVYNFKNAIDNKVLELSNEILMKNNTTASEKIKKGLETIKSSESGIVTFYVDNYEDKTIENLAADDFNIEGYIKSTVKSGDVINSGTEVFKLIADENWHIICKVGTEEAEYLREVVRKAEEPEKKKTPKVTFTINNSEFDITSEFALVERDGYTLVDISLNKYLVDYVADRFLTIELILNESNGLKVPNSALVEKTLYKLPKQYVAVEPGTTTYNKAYVQDIDAEGNLTVKMVDLDILKKDDEYYYVDPDTFKETDVLVQNETGNTIGVTLLGTEIIKGVYQVNKGMADFMMVTILKVGDNFTIVDKKGKLKQYDNIIMDADGITENQIIY